MAEKFQKKKLNRDDHKKMDKAVKGIKNGGKLVAGVCAVCVFVKKSGPQIANFAKNIIMKA